MIRCRSADFPESLHDPFRRVGVALVVGFLPKENSPSLDPGDPCGTNEAIRSRVRRIGKSFVERHKLVATLLQKTKQFVQRFAIDLVVVHQKDLGDLSPKQFFCGFFKIGKLGLYELQVLPFCLFGQLGIFLRQRFMQDVAGRL